MSLFDSYLSSVDFWRFELMILCNFRWDLANQCMPKWIETKRKTVEITVKILKWWCITVITVNTQTIGNSSSNSLRHNTFMDPQPPLQVTRGFENNFPWLPCAWFLHQQSWKHKKMRSSAKTKLLQDVRISPQQQRCTHFNNENDEPFPPAKVLQFSTSENSKQNLWWSTQYLSFPCCYSTTLEHSKKSLSSSPSFTSYLLMKNPFCTSFGNIVEFCSWWRWTLGKKCWRISKNKWKHPNNNKTQSLCATTTPFIRLLIIITTTTEEPLNFHIPIHIHHCVKKCSI